ncbi:MAG: alpha/beta hydrolase [Micromonosporaceae bacterium]|nr:alpha/beta hydrolase [Micromonosporaceae bacterium]
MSFFPGCDGVDLAYREVGEGRPLILLHGFMGDATLWLRHGQVEAMAARGLRVILPDFRGHGASAKPDDAVAYPPDVLADDGFALIEYLGLDDYDLGGYSLGARIAVRMLARGTTPGCTGPRRAVIGGQGLREVLGIGGGAGAVLRRVVAAPGRYQPGSAEGRTEQWLRSSGQDPVALLRVLDSVVATPVELLDDIQVPTLVLMGTDDERAVSAEQLVAAMPNATLAMVPGDHATAVAAPEFVAALLDFLAG